MTIRNFAERIKNKNNFVKAHSVLGGVRAFDMYLMLLPRRNYKKSRATENGRIKKRKRTATKAAIRKKKIPKFNASASVGSSKIITHKQCNKRENE